jgi:hypothetical protein
MRRPADCGTECGYRRHLAAHEFACQACCDAHAVAVANWRARARVVAPSNEPLYRACRLGRDPAEALSTEDRERLVDELHRLGWSDTQIAEHTRMSTYTTVRIRERLMLPANAGVVRRAGSATA